MNILILHKVIYILEDDNQKEVEVDYHFYLCRHTLDGGVIVGIFKFFECFIVMLLLFVYFLIQLTIIVVSNVQISQYYNVQFHPI